MRYALLLCTDKNIYVPVLLLVNIGNKVQTDIYFVLMLALFVVNLAQEARETGKPHEESTKGFGSLKKQDTSYV